MSSVIAQARKKSANPNFWVRIFSGRVGVFHVKGSGPKSSVCPSKTGKSDFFGGTSRDFARISQNCPKSLRETKKFVFSFWPLITLGNVTAANSLKIWHVLGNDWCCYFREEKQHKHKLFGPDFPRTFLTLTPGCPGVKKFLPITGAAEKRTFWCGRPRFSARTSMTRRVVEKLCTKKVCVDFLAPSFCPEATILTVTVFLTVSCGNYHKT